MYSMFSSFKNKITYLSPISSQGNKKSHLSFFGFVENNFISFFHPKSQKNTVNEPLTCKGRSVLHPFKRYIRVNTSYFAAFTTLLLTLYIRICMYISFQEQTFFARLQRIILGDVNFINSYYMHNEAPVCTLTML